MNKRQRKKRNKKVQERIKNEVETIARTALFRFDDHWDNIEQYMKNGVKLVIPKTEIIDIVIEGGN